jgi:ElaB/YqjD/DUF883 family membrane-anchored ribosome-binding protein
MRNWSEINTERKELENHLNALSILKIVENTPDSHQRDKLVNKIKKRLSEINAEIKEYDKAFLQSQIKNTIQNAIKYLQENPNVP